MYDCKYVCWPVNSWLLSLCASNWSLDWERCWEWLENSHHRNTSGFHRVEHLQPNIPSYVLMTVERLRRVEVRFGFGEKWTVTQSKIQIKVTFSCCNIEIPPCSAVCGYYVCTANLTLAHLLFPSYLSLTALESLFIAAYSVQECKIWLCSLANVLVLLIQTVAVSSI